MYFLSCQLDLNFLYASYMYSKKHFHSSMMSAIFSLFIKIKRIYTKSARSSHHRSLCFLERRRSKTIEYGTTSIFFPVHVFHLCFLARLEKSNIFYTFEHSFQFHVWKITKRILTKVSFYNNCRIIESVQEFLIQLEIMLHFFFFDIRNRWNFTKVFALSVRNL